MAATGVRRAGRATLIAAGAVCLSVLVVHVRNAQGASVHIALDAFWQSVFVTPLVAAVLVLSDVCLGWVERRWSAGGRTVPSLAVMATGIMVAAGLTALVVHEAPPVTVPAEEGRAALEQALDRLIVAAGSEPADLGGAITRLPRQGSEVCRDGRGRVSGEFLHWTYETTNTVVASALTRTPHGLASFRPETLNAVARMVDALRAEEFYVDDRSSSIHIHFTAQKAPASNIELVANLSDVNATLRADAATGRQKEFPPTLPVEIHVRALSPCLRS